MIQTVSDLTYKGILFRDLMTQFYVYKILECRLYRSVSSFDCKKEDPCVNVRQGTEGMLDRTSQ